MKGKGFAPAEEDPVGYHALNKVEAKPKEPATRGDQGDVKETKPKKTKAKMSGLDAAAKVLGESKEPMGTKQIVEVALPIDPAELERRLRHRAHRNRRR